MKQSLFIFCARCSSSKWPMRTYMTTPLGNMYELVSRHQSLTGGVLTRPVYKLYAPAPRPALMRHNCQRAALAPASFLTRADAMPTVRGGIWLRAGGARPGLTLQSGTSKPPPLTRAHPSSFKTLFSWSYAGGVFSDFAVRAYFSVFACKFSLPSTLHCSCGAYSL